VKRTTESGRVWVRRVPLVVLIAPLVVLLPVFTWANTTATWVGNVVHADTKQISVNAKQRTRRFLIGDDFQGVKTSYGDKKKTLADLKPGTTVQVTYYTDAVAHVDRALKVTIVNGFNLNIPLGQTPSPPAVPHANPTSMPVVTPTSTH
jgi:hypothetical protein